MEIYVKKSVWAVMVTADGDTCPNCDGELNGVLFTTVNAPPYKIKIK